MAFRADRPPPRWRRRRNGGCLPMLIAASALTVGVLAGVVAGQALVDDWDQQAQEARL